MTAPSLSVLIVARNEEQHLADCLASAGFAEERVVILDRSTDRSAEIARAAGARVVEGAWPLEGVRRTAGLDACTGDWILELDADERVTPELAEEIRRRIEDPAVDYYLIRLRNHIGGVWVRHGWGAYNGVGAKNSLFRRGHKVWGQGEVHPRIELKGKGAWMTAEMLHYVYRDVAAMIDRLNRYSSAAALDLALKPELPRPRTTFRRAFSRFYKAYWHRKGYREGWRGVALALFSGLYPVLTHVKALELREQRAKKAG